MEVRVCTTVEALYLHISGWIQVWKKNGLEGNPILLHLFPIVWTTAKSCQLPRATASELDSPLTQKF